MNEITLNNLFSNIVFKNNSKVITERKSINNHIVSPYIDLFIEENEEDIFNCYCETFPEYITSDFSLEDIEDIEEFVNDYMQSNLEEFVKGIEKGVCFI